MASYVEGVCTWRLDGSSRVVVPFDKEASPRKREVGRLCSSNGAEGGGGGGPDLIVGGES